MQHKSANGKRQRKIPDVGIGFLSKDGAMKVASSQSSLLFFILLCRGEPALITHPVVIHRIMVLIRSDRHSFLTVSVFCVTKSE